MPRLNQNHRNSGGEIEVEMNGTMHGMHLGSNHETGPTVESMSSEPGHDQDSDRKPSLIARFTKWIQKPMNLALFLWLIPILIGLVLALLLMSGALKDAIKGSERRKKWEEAVNQLLNALFTVGCLFTHPEVFYHLLYVVRWRPEDQEKVRGIYCKYKTPEPRDRKHLFVVVFLINLTWVGQYIMCGLYWAYNRHNRPSGVLSFWVVITLVAPVAASIYTVKGPLKSKKTEEEKRAQDAEAAQQEELSFKFCSGGVAIANPEWDGGLFDCCDETKVCLSSFFCMFCVFGRNTNRLGFGSRNMHIVTFMIAVISPFVVFLITALKIDHDGLKVLCIAAGALLSWVGFFYGGYWRIKMRKRFNLPESEFCTGVLPFSTDYFRWLFCGPCALAQEVRTANNYDIEEGHTELVSLPREANSRNFQSNRSFSYPPKAGPADEAPEPSNLGRSSTYSNSKVHVMAPPQRPYM